MLHGPGWLVAAPCDDLLFAQLQLGQDACQRLQGRRLASTNAVLMLHSAVTITVMPIIGVVIVFIAQCTRHACTRQGALVWPHGKAGLQD